MARPQHLPDFTAPPLDEVVLGIQFAPPAKYSSIFARDVWNLFKDDYPIVQEHQPLDPFFETFGGSPVQTGPMIRFGAAPLRSRLWFLSSEPNHLIQFQEDRFLLNWRRANNGQLYPRYETIADSFQKNVESLQRFSETVLATQLDINQAEISYINIIPLEDYSKAGDWLSIWGLVRSNVESIQLVFNEIVHDPDGKPYARLYNELQSVVSPDGRVKALKLSLTFRGKPSSKGLSDVMAFMKTGREKIVTQFSELTTRNAHESWGRKQ